MRKFDFHYCSSLSNWERVSRTSKAVNYYLMTNEYVGTKIYKGSDFRVLGED